jgi:two-component system chemotaxis sensor kinase CheA
MEEIQGKLSEAIEQLAIQSIMIEPEDMMTLGSILEQVEAIEKICAENSFDTVQKLSNALKIVVEKIILKEFQESQEGLNLLGAGSKLIQQKIDHPDEKTLPSPEEEIFWKKLGTLGIVEKPAPFAEEETSEGKTPSDEPSGIAQDVELYKDFIAEALEHLGSIELNLINLEQSPEDRECINAIFRPFHTVKGVSGFLNLKEINRFSHAMESLLDRARNDKLRISQELIDFILEAVDLLKAMIIDLKGHVDSGQLGHSHFDLEPYLQKIASFQEGHSLTEGGPAVLSKGDGGGPPIGEILNSRGIISREDLSEALREQATDRTGLRIGEILIKENKARPKEVMEALREQKKITAQGTEATVKVDTGKLDNLLDMIGELVIAQSLVQHNPVFASINDQKLNRDFSQLKRITNDLQKVSMSLRMIPIRQTFQKMIRLVRDLARKSGKRVDLTMSGEETEIDRNMVDALYEPLVHMIRNSVDHGIESSPRRGECGKSEIGQIRLRAYQKGGNVIIEVEDDGQGLNREKILKKAKERGLVAEGMTITEYQIDNLIFEPGFSTADQVTDVSGRGVGMDVVRKAIEKLKGKIEISSVEGKGTRFVMRVPLTLAIMDGIIIQVGKERYILPTVFVKETLRPRPEDISTVQKKGDLVTVRNTLLPLVRLYELFGVPPRKKEPWEALVVVVENDGRQKGLMVDDLVGKQEVVIKKLGEILKETEGVAGSTIMGDGRVGLILDVHGIFQIDQKDEGRRCSSS